MVLNLIFICMFEFQVLGNIKTVASIKIPNSVLLGVEPPKGEANAYLVNPKYFSLPFWKRPDGESFWSSLQ